MFFLDSAGFFSIVSLIAQWGLCLMLLVLLAVLQARLERPLWLRRWSKAYLALAVALSAVLARFLFAHVPVAGPHPLEESSAWSRLLYGTYFGGKLAFLWFLLSGTAALRQLAWPRFRAAVLPGTAAAALLGWLLPTVEWHLVVQAPLFAGTCLAAYVLLRPYAQSRGDVGSRIVGLTLVAWAVLWLLYGLAALAVNPSQPSYAPPWSYVLRLNSFVDLLLQSALAYGLLVLVLQDAQHAITTTVAERDRLRTQVQRDEKLVALTTLVSGVAHELNNPLTAILGFAEDLDAGDPGQRAAAARVVREQAERCRGIVRRLSTMAGGQTVACRPTHLALLIERVARGFGPELAAARVRLEVRVQPDLPVVAVDPTAIEQVLTNLVGNALYASPPDGRIGVEATVDAQGISVAIDDEGCGVPPQIRDRLFEPFFTTKPPGQGSGLGLAVANALVRAHRGTLELQDREARGARFVVRLPLPTTALSTPAPDVAVAHRDAPAGTAGLLLLVVDDESFVRDTVARHARRNGWRVEEADSGAMALTLLHRADRRFDAVLCDLRMPGLSGIELHDRLRDESPDLLGRFVFVTGDPTSSLTTSFAQRCDAPIVAKPFEFPELFATLARVSTGTRS